MESRKVEQRWHWSHPHSYDTTFVYKDWASSPPTPPCKHKLRPFGSSTKRKAAFTVVNGKKYSWLKKQENGGSVNQSLSTNQLPCSPQQEWYTSTDEPRFYVHDGAFQVCDSMRMAGFRVCLMAVNHDIRKRDSIGLGDALSTTVKPWLSGPWAYEKPKYVSGKNMAN